MLSWACTVHKVQCLSLTSVVVSFALEKQKPFKEGQIIATLSRVTIVTLSGVTFCDWEI